MLQEKALNILPLFDSHDPCTCSFFLAKDRPWAVRRRSKSGDETPEGHACESCFNTWHQHFSHLDWDQFSAEMKKPDSSLKQHLQSVRDCADNPARKVWKPQSVVEGHTYVVELVKNFVALSHSELRRALGVSRLSKVAVSHVPTLLAKKEDGSLEELYMFRNEAKTRQRSECEDGQCS